MRNLAIISGGSVAAFDGRIVAIGKTHEVRGKVNLTSNAQVIDAKGKVVLPGFVDSHTHLVLQDPEKKSSFKELKARPILRY